MRYFLNIIRGDETIRDDEGEEFSTLDLAVEAAQQSLRDIAAEHLLQGSRMTMKAIEIYDEDRHYQTTVDVVTAISECLPQWQ